MWHERVLFGVYVAHDLFGVAHGGQCLWGQPSAAPLANGPSKTVQTESHRQKQPPMRHQNL